MRILFFSYYNPLGKGGFEKQGMGLMKTLASQGHELACLTVATPDNANQIKSNLEATQIFKLGCFVIPHQEKKYSLKAKILFWISSNPVDVILGETSELKCQVDSIINIIINNAKIEVIHCLSLRTSYYLTSFTSYPLVLDLVDSYTNLKKRYIQYYLSNLQIKNFLLLYPELIKTARIEKDILKKYSQFPVAVVSPVDKKCLLEINYQSPVFVVNHPHTLNISEKNELNMKPENKIITFYGSLDKANTTALDYLIKDILPKVIQKHYNLKLLITGISLSEKIFNLEKTYDWIKVVPTVDNIEDFASQSTLNCWPFRLGTGFKNKIIESMALSKPVVTTTIGAEALTESQKQGLLIADNAQGLADHISYLLDNSDEALRLGKINHQIAITEFTWEKKAQDYLQLYELAKDNLKIKNQ
ncbi:glycosyltransferase family 4 protein [Chrysosporum ovalisporum FSS-45]|uniref:glycosyltransferase family 4 protein n=1 Tax=Umezakia ovalisporum TaxID=75695 RepID=UPI002474FD11|nr:glycosyltransferase family 4 protein [Umezakia ovalisporum]MDH6076674.1 glycosyltransferase family 4 protein [Umezakia ovalisporum FSS-45]